MKTNKSNLKELLREVLVEVLPEVLQEIMDPYASMSDVEKYINEVIGEDTTPKYIKRTPIDRSQLTTGGNPYGSNNTASSVSPMSAPDNKRGVVNGESFASGQGLLEWFSKTKKPDHVELSEFKHKTSDIDALIKKTMG